MISTPSYPAAFARCAERTKSSMVRSTPLSESARGLKRIDGRFQCAWRNVERMVAVPATVQNLHEDASSFSMHCFRDDFVFLGVPRALHSRAIRTQYTSTIGADPTGNDKPGTTTGPFGIKRCQLAEPIGFLFKPKCMLPMMIRLGSVRCATCSGENKRGYVGCWLNRNPDRNPPSYPFFAAKPCTGRRNFDRPWRFLPSCSPSNPRVPRRKSCHWL